MYITLEEYTTYYNDMDLEPMDEYLFRRLSMDACRYVDIHTTGIDNIKKLKIAFPTDENDAAAVKFCAAKVLHFLHQIHTAELSAMETRGYEATEQGMRGKVISSVTAGNESITYSAGTSAAALAVDAAVKDKTTKEKMVADMIWESLSGVADANGVNLLFMGRYPRRYLC